MDQVRNFAQSNRSSIVNIIYIVAAVVLVYYLVMYYMDSDYKDKDLLNKKMATESLGDGQRYDIATSSNNKHRAKSEYTLSFWLYINSYETTVSNKHIMALFDGYTAGGSNTSLLTFALDAKQPKMIIRASTSTGTPSPVNKYSTTTPGWEGTTPTETDNGLAPCDIMDIDMQRWINITVSVNGRIMDVYMDGKLARSCILDNIQNFGSSSDQFVALMPSGFRGHISGIRWSNYAVTPDVIYGRYQAGPYFGTSFLDYLVDKLGIRISYTGSSASDTDTFGIWDSIMKSS